MKVPLFRRVFADSLDELKNTRHLATCAMLLAVQLLLGYMGSIYISPTLQISFSYLAASMVAYLFGPVPAMINSALSDIIGYVLRPMGAYYPGFTLTAITSGMIYGLFFYRRPISQRRVIMAKIVVDVVCSLGMNTLWLYHMQGKAFMVLLPPRVIKNMMQLPIDAALLMLLFRSMRRVFKSLGRPLIEPESRRRPVGRRALGIAIALVWLVAAVWLNNSSALVGETNPPKHLAHRGLAQTFDIKNVEWDTNTAEIIYPPEHEYFENTIASMARAFELGADVVELDLHRTKDDQLAVFHDYLVDYRTDGKGAVSDFTMDELKQLDIGYGYTADGGQTWPFRGKGVGMMPEFHEVLSAFPDHDLLIHLKDGDVRLAELVWDAVMGMEPEVLARLAFYGDDAAMQYLSGQSAELRVMSSDTLKSALIHYELVGWSGYIPESMKHTEIHIPLKYARFLWGWPARFMQRMDSVDTRVVLVDGDGTWSEGFDDEQAYAEIPANYSGYVWTNRIDRIGGAE